MPIPGNQQLIAACQVRGLVTAGGSTSKNQDQTFYFQRSTTVNPFTKSNIEIAFQSAIAAVFIPLLNVRYTQLFNTVRCLNDAQDPIYQNTRTVAGAVTGDSMPTFNALYVLARTALRGRSYRGSKHFFPMSESDTTGANGDVFKAATVSAWTAFNTAWLAGFTDSDGNIWKPVIISKSLSQTSKNPTTVVANPIQALLINTRVGRMRKREVASVY